MTGVEPSPPSRPSWRAAEARLPGLRTICFLLTVLTVLLALCAEQPDIDPWLRSLWFAVLLAFFRIVARREPQVAVLPFRLIQHGFSVLTAGYAAAAVLRGLGEGRGQLELSALAALERGAVFLLGLTLIAYGICLWIPALLDSKRVLREAHERTRGALAVSESARSRIEARIADADRLHVLGELAAGIAHDLRNPLAIVKTTAASLAHASRTAEELAEHSRVIARAVDRAEQTIAGLLELGRPHAPQPDRVELAALARDVLALVTVESRRRGVAVELCAERVAASVDPDHLRQVVLNLVLNALQSSAPGSKVLVKAIARRGTALLLVEDRGRGIQPRDRDKLFTPFFTTKPGGIGLGLLSSRRLLADMGGSVGLYPRTRGGARALVRLPLAAEAAQVGVG